MDRNRNALSGPEAVTAHPAAWRGRELLQRADWVTELTAGDIDEIKAALQAGGSAGGDDARITAAGFPLAGLREKLLAIRHQLEHGAGAVMVRGLPIDAFPAGDCRRLFLGISSHIGTPVSQSAAGELLFSVRDSGYADDDPRARGPNTRKKLTYHTDRCDVIGFCCVQQAKSGGESFVVSSMTLYDEIRRHRPDLLAVLEEPFYYARHNVDLANERPWCRQPVFSFQDGHFAANLLRVLIDRAYAMPELPDMSPVQREALDHVQKLADDPSLHVSFMQQPGDILFLNNWVTLHRRAEFEDHPEPDRKRHLLRVWLSVPNSRPLHPLFRENYGATEAGALRGGMHRAPAPDN